MRTLGIMLTSCTLLITATPTVSSARSGSARQVKRQVPRDPGLFSRMFGTGSHRAVRQTLRQAKRASSKPAMDRALRASFAQQMKQGTLSIHGAIKLAKATHAPRAHNTMMRAFATYHRDGLSVKQVLRLAKGTYSHPSHNTILVRYATRHMDKLSVKDVIKLAKTTTYVGPNNRIIEAYKTRHGAKLGASQLKKLDKALASASSGSSRRSRNDGLNVEIGISDNGMPTTTVGGVGMPTVGHRGNVYIQTGAGISVNTGLDLW